MWAFGLSAEQEKKLREVLTEEYALRCWPDSTTPDMAEFDADKPRLYIFSIEGYKTYRAKNCNSLNILDIVPQVMLLSENASAEDLQYAVDSDCLAVLRPNLDQDAFIKKLEQLLEISEVQNDILRLSNEIYLEREIYERKNNVLQFLVSFLTKTSKQRNFKEIIRTAFSSLNMLFPVRSMHLALWNTESSPVEVQMFMTSPKNGKSFAAWHNLMQKQLHIEFAASACNTHVTVLKLRDQAKEWVDAKPGDGYMLNLPVTLADTPIGFISILTDMERSLTRDQAQALNAALQFLAYTFNKVYIDEMKIAQVVSS
jgi:hypothetical protein